MLTGRFRALHHRWRLQHCPDKEVIFPQDWTNANELGVRIGGEPCPHLLCHVVLSHPVP